VSNSQSFIGVLWEGERHGSVAITEEDLEEIDDDDEQK